MNIFALDLCPTKSAQMQHDKHVVKMVLESAQMLCSAFDQDKHDVPYKKAHYNHPCTIWARNSYSNFEWLAAHGLALAQEYTHRYKKTHKSQTVIQWCIDNMWLVDMPTYELTPFAQAMPDKYKNIKATKAYQDYYIGTKLSNAKWTNRVVPKIFQPHIN